jgi:hypothetical protein
MGGMTEAERTAWIRTVLTITGTEPQRRAFIDGFNGYGLTRHFSRAMQDRHELGKQVHGILHPAKERL